MKQLAAQGVGLVSVRTFTFVASLVLWYALKYTLGVRVSAVEETEGLDLHEIGVWRTTAMP